MKDIYELLNDLDMKDDDFEEMEVSDIERAIVKKNLKKSIRNKRSKRKAISVAAMAIACTVVLGTTITYAEDIPIIRDIFKALDNKVYEDYKDSANEINATQVSNGISVTMNDAVFDGRTVSLTFTIESEKEFGKSITMDNIVRIKDMEEYAMTSGYKFEKFHGNTYIGQMDMTILDLIDEPLENIGFTLDISKIGNLMRDEDFVEGDWCFDLNLEAVAGNVINVDSAVTNEGITAKVKDLTINPMSIFISYTYEMIEEATEKWDEVDLFLDVKDDLGNTYMLSGNGSVTDRLSGKFSSTMENLKEGATKLIITPRARVRKLGEPRIIEQEYKDNITGETKVENTETRDCIDSKQIEFEKIIVDVK